MSKQWVQHISNPPLDKPMLVYDGNCGFCRRWVVRLQIWTGDQFDFEPFQRIHEAYQEIPQSQFEQSFHLIDTDGKVYYGARAIFLALKRAPGFAWWWWLYRLVPGFAWASEIGYIQVAKNRNFFDRVMRWTFGKDDAVSTYAITRNVFLRALGLVYLFAFASFWVQVHGLIGSDGILPVADYFQSAHAQVGNEAYWLLPSLLWLNASDVMLHLLCLGGVLGSVMLMFGLLPVISLIVLYVFYLSLSAGGQVFLQYQWDALLLETGFLAIFFAPWAWRMKFTDNRKPPRFLLYVFWFLLFRLMYSSGVVKLLSGDIIWRDLSALQYHYQTQPIPNPIAWFAHNLPDWFHAFSCLGMFGIELLVPFLIFTPRFTRAVACGLLVILQILILLTGNYGYFNILSIVLCFLLIDDVYWKKILPDRLTKKAPFINDFQREMTPKRWLNNAVGVTILLLGVLQMALLFQPDIRDIPTVSQTFRVTQPFHLVNRYGLFAVMTRDRPEIILEGSMDQASWQQYDFKWKIDSEAERPPFAVPHMPRVSWQMWFAALGDYRQNHWLLSLQERLLLGNETVQQFFEENPFPDQPPKFIRARVYDYRFTTWKEANDTNNWWVATEEGLYNPVLSLRER